jgi:hypothetical protein
MDSSFPEKHPKFYGWHLASSTRAIGVTPTSVQYQGRRLPKDRIGATAYEAIDI